MYLIIIPVATLVAFDKQDLEAKVSELLQYGFPVGRTEQGVQMMRIKKEMIVVLDVSSLHVDLSTLKIDENKPAILRA